MCFASEKSLRLVAMMAHGSDQQQQQANGSGDGDGDHEDPYIVFGYGSLIFRVRSISITHWVGLVMTTANERTKPPDPSCSLN
jgi:hypothetical protein